MIHALKRALKEGIQITFVPTKSGKVTLKAQAIITGGTRLSGSWKLNPDFIENTRMKYVINYITDEIIIRKKTEI
jgi:hypothetical protein